MTTAKRISNSQKYAYYQKAVQAPDAQLKNYLMIYKDIFHKTPYRLREDFSGTFLFSCEWIKSNKNRTALAIDFDPEPLNYGIKHNLMALPADTQSRMTLLRDDVRTITGGRPHIIDASNFSFNFFKKKEDLQTYFHATHETLDKNGILLLDVVGGKGFTEAPACETKICMKEDKNGNEKPWFTYYWNTHRYDSKTRNGLWSISVNLKGGRKINKHFEYDWHLWSLNEIKSTLLKVGYSQVVVYQQDPDDGVYRRIEKNPKDYCWICLVAGVK